MTLEICVDSMESALNAVSGGADRLELCASLSEGGLTPDLGFIEEVVKKVNIPVNVMLRPRCGDFLYSDVEFKIMMRGLELISETGAYGIVFGILTADGEIDIGRCRKIIHAARPMSVTFHRAFDMVPDPLKALDDLSGLGVDRLLTSGGKTTAWEGRLLIAELVRLSDNRIVIMAGSGVNEENILPLIRETGVTECHASARVERESPVRYRNNGLTMGSGTDDEYRRMVTDTGRVRTLKSLTDNM